MTLINKIVARLGFVRVPKHIEKSWLPRQYHEPIPEIIIFENRDAAREAGFRGWRHETQPHISAWWPGANVQALSGRPVQRVTIPSKMLRQTTSEGDLVAILKSRQKTFYGNALWIVV